jgi:hypothetical protein
VAAHQDDEDQVGPVASAAGRTSSLYPSKEPIMKIKTKVRAGRECGTPPKDGGGIIIAP